MLESPPAINEQVGWSYLPMGSILAISILPWEGKIQNIMLVVPTVSCHGISKAGSC
jgi:hypothetical protein